MMYIVENPTSILLFSTMPICGWLLYKTVNRQLIMCACLFSFIFFLPAFTDYTYIVDIINPLMLYICSACLYSFIFYKFRKTIFTLIIPALLLLVMLSTAYFFAALPGSITVQQRWELKGYRVDYIQNQGLAGGPLMTFDLYEYAVIPVFIKRVDSKVDEDTTNNCTVTFEYKHFHFNKCAK
jgi:hypothetical protein